MGSTPSRLQEKRRLAQTPCTKQRWWPLSYPHDTFAHTHSHTPAHTGEAVYTAHTSLSPFIHSSAKFGGSSEGICLQWRGLRLLNIQAWARIRKFITAVAGFSLKVVRRGSDATKGQLSLLKCFKSLPDILQIRCYGFMQCWKAISKLW